MPACCKLSTDLLQVDCLNLLSTGLLQISSTSCDKSSANDRSQQGLILGTGHNLAGGVGSGNSGGSHTF